MANIQTLAQNFTPTDRIVYVAYDGRTGQLIKEVSYVARYFDEKYKDGIKQANKIFGQEVLLAND